MAVAPGALVLSGRTLEPQVAIPKENMIAGNKHPKKLFIGGISPDTTSGTLCFKHKD